MNLRKLGIIDTLDTDINLELLVAGEGISKETAIGDVELTVKQSRFMWLDIEQGKALASFSANGVNIDTVHIVTH